MHLNCFTWSVESCIVSKSIKYSRAGRRPLSYRHTRLRQRRGTSQALRGQLNRKGGGRGRGRTPLLSHSGRQRSRTLAWEQRPPRSRGAASTAGGRKKKKNNKHPPLISRFVLVQKQTVQSWISGLWEVSFKAKRRSHPSLLSWLGVCHRRCHRHSSSSSDVWRPSDKRQESNK